MHRNYFHAIVIISILCLFLIFFTLWHEIQTPATKEPNIPPPVAPFRTSIAGVGLVEPSSGNILIGTPLSRIVSKVNAAVGEKVKKGDVLFSLDDSDLKANLIAQKAAYASSLAKLQRLEAFPRPEDVTAANAAADKAKAEFDSAKTQYEMVNSLPDPRAISQEEKNRRLANYQQKEAQWKQAQVDLEKVQSGTWKPDLEIARKELQEAAVNVNKIRTELERTYIRSPIDGTVLQINIHQGELVSDNPQKPAMIVGNTDDLYLKVSINQLDIPRFRPDEPAVAYFQSNANVKFPLEFIAVEPYLVAKTNFTNEVAEKTDTRVLKILYRLKNDHQPVYVGQQMDVFIDTNEALKE